MALYDWALQDSEFGDPLDFLGGAPGAGYLGNWANANAIGAAGFLNPAVNCSIQGDTNRQRVVIVPNAHLTNVGGMYFTSIANDFVYLARFGIGAGTVFDGSTAHIQLVALDGTSVATDYAYGAGLHIPTNQFPNSVMSSGVTSGLIGTRFNTWNMLEWQTAAKMSTIDVAIQRSGTSLITYAARQRGPFFRLGTPSTSGGGIITGATPIIIRAHNFNVGRDNRLYLRAFARVSVVPGL